MILKIPECGWKFELSYFSLGEAKQRHRLTVNGRAKFRNQDARCSLSVIEKSIEGIDGNADVYYSKYGHDQFDVTIDVTIYVSKEGLFAFMDQLKIQYPTFKSIEVGFDWGSAVKIGYLKDRERINVSNLTISVNSQDTD